MPLAHTVPSLHTLVTATHVWWTLMRPCALRVHSGSALCDSLAIIVAARKQAIKVGATDQLLAQDLEDLAGRMELVVAGCLRTIRDEELPQLFSLFDSPLGQIALKVAVRKKCLVICALPQTQIYYERKFWLRQLDGGPLHMDYTQKLLLKPHGVLRDIVVVCMRLLLLPAVAVLPSLQRSRFFAYSPAFR